MLPKVQFFTTRVRFPEKMPTRNLRNVNADESALYKEIFILREKCLPVILETLMLMIVHFSIQGAFDSLREKCLPIILKALRLTKMHISKKEV